MADLPVEQLLNILNPPQSAYEFDPTGWIQTRLREHLWSKQQEILASVCNNRRTAVPSCHGSGKSYTASRAALWWVENKADPFVVTSAPSAPQVRAILWENMRRGHSAGRLSGEMLQVEWKINEHLVAFGRKPADYAPDAFQGIHHQHVLVIFDEANGIPYALWVAAISLLANEDCRMLAIGNPDDSASYFAKVCGPGSGWNTIGISAFDTPNFTDEVVPEPLARNLVSKLWVNEAAAEWGEDSPTYISKVLGRFPEDATDTVVPWSMINGAKIRESVVLEPIELGLDVGAGGDESVIQERRGMKISRKWVNHSRDTMEVVGLALQAIDETSATAIKVDTIGIGWAVGDRLHELYMEGKHGARVVRVNVGESSRAPDRFPKLRDQIWWEVGRELMDTVDLTEADDKLLSQLAAPRWSRDSANRIKIESKAETKKRLGHSPDHADAYLLAFYTDPSVGTIRSRADAIVGARI